LSEQTPEQARAEYEKERQTAVLTESVRGHYLALALQQSEQTPEGIAAIAGGLDDRGGWRDEISLLDPFQPFTTPQRKIAAYTTGGYIARMYRLINYLHTMVNDKR
jgi:hypothetical protein